MSGYRLERKYQNLTEDNGGFRSCKILLNLNLYLIWLNKNTMVNCYKIVKDSWTNFRTSQDWWKNTDFSARFSIWFA